MNKIKTINSWLITFAICLLAAFAILKFSTSQVSSEKLSALKAHEKSDIANDTEKTLEFLVSENENLSLILSKIQVNNKDLAKVLSLSKKHKSLRLVQPGTKISFSLNYANCNNIENSQLTKQANNISVNSDGNTQKIKKDIKILPAIKPDLKSFKIFASKTEQVVVEKIANNFTVKILPVKFEKRIYSASKQLRSGIADTLRSFSVDHNTLRQIVAAFKKARFQHNAHEDNRLNIVYEKLYDENGQFSHNGKVLYVAVASNKKLHEFYLFEQKPGSYQFLTANAQPSSSARFVMPVSYKRISSKFGVRIHPVTGVRHMHPGVDLAAKYGTPIVAMADGKVVQKCWKGGYGNYMQIRHKRGVYSAYAHASRFAKGVKKGSFVKAGQIIAYVGMTGTATGAHLHAELCLNGKRVDPIRFINANSKATLTTAQIKKFNSLKSVIAKLKPSFAAGREFVAKVKKAKPSAFHKNAS